MTTTLSTPADGTAQRPCILQAGRLLPDLQQALAERHDSTRLADQADPAAFLAEHDALFQGYFASAGVGIGSALMDQLPTGCASSLDNVVLTPHTASGTHETRRAMGQRVIDNLDAFFRDGTLVSPAP